MKTLETRDGYLTIYVHSKNSDETEMIVRDIGECLISRERVIYLTLLKYSIFDTFCLLLKNCKVVQRKLNYLHIIDLPKITVDIIQK